MEKETIKEKIHYFWKIYFEDKYWSCRSWIKYHLRRRFFNIVKTCLKTYPWDYSYLYQIEEAKLKEMLDYHKNSHIVCEESRQQKIRTIQWALNMLHIIQNESDYFDYRGGIKFELIEDKDDDGKPLYRANMDDLEYIQKCKVNIQNYKRFNLPKNIIDLHPHELYVEKARYLYHKIRLNYEQIWWD